MKTRAAGSGMRSGQKGFTALETMLAIGLSALVLLAGWEFFTRYNSHNKTLMDTIENATDIESGQQIMLRDLKALNPSFSALNILADADENGKRANLLDFFPDVPESSPGLARDPICGRPCRTYTMRALDGFAEILFLLEDSRASDTPSMVYDPTWAFSLSATSNPNVNGPMPHFLGVNNGNVVGLHRPATPTKGGYWKEKQLLMLDSPALFRPTGSEVTHVPPRSPFFVGEVRGSQLAPLPPQTFEIRKYRSATWDPAMGMTVDQTGTAVLNRTHPLNASLVIDSAEHFFDWLPPSGGGQPLVRLRPVQLVRYTAELMFPAVDPAMEAPERQKRTGALRVWRQVYNSGPAHDGWNDATKFLIAEYVKSVQLRRPTVTDRAIFFNLSKDKLKNGGEN